MGDTMYSLFQWPFFKVTLICTSSQCLKITEKVSFHVASKASYVYILSEQKFTKICQNGEFLKPEACGQTVLPDRSILIGQKLLEKDKIENATF